MARPERDYYLSVFRLHTGDFVESEEISLGGSPYGEIVKRIGTRNGETEVRYGIRGTDTDIKGFPYEEDGVRGFEILQVFSSPEENSLHIKRGQEIFEH